MVPLVVRQTHVRFVHLLYKFSHLGFEIIFKSPLILYIVLNLRVNRIFKWYLFCFCLIINFVHFNILLYFNYIQYIKN